MKTKNLLLMAFTAITLIACRKDEPEPPTPPTPPTPEEPKDTIATEKGSGRTIELEEYEVDWQHWRKYGKEDKITMQEPDLVRYKFVEAERFEKFDHKFYQNEFKHLGSRILTGQYSENLEIELEMRYVLLDMKGNIVEQFQPFTKKAHEGKIVDDILVYVTAPPGKYILQPLFREKGQTNWTKMVLYYQDPAEEWTIEVLPTPEKNQPYARVLQVVGMEPYPQVKSYSVPKNFTIGYVLYNPHKVNIKGEIKVQLEREFKNEGNTYFPRFKDEEVHTNLEDYVEEIGRTQVEIPAGKNGYLGTVPCVFPDHIRKSVRKDGSHGEHALFAAPDAYLYFKAEGTTEWKLIRVDATRMAKMGQDETNFPRFTNKLYALSKEGWLKLPD